MFAFAFLLLLPLCALSLVVVSVVLLLLLGFGGPLLFWSLLYVFVVVDIFLVSFSLSSLSLSKSATAPPVQCKQTHSLIPCSVVAIFSHTFHYSKLLILRASIIIIILPLFCICACVFPLIHSPHSNSLVK